MKIKVLGDPHLGRSFIHGVPLHRRGEREQMMWKSFEEGLQGDYDVHINLGDLFDSSVVPYDVIIRAANLYTKAVEDHPEAEFIILRGNHDLMRDLTRSAAFDVFERLVPSQVRCVKSKSLRVGDLAFIGYDPLVPAADLLGDDLKGVETIYGHWDTEFSEHNLIPTARMAELGIKNAVTGHVHKREEFKRDGVEVLVWGSMQPYAHGQESDESLYLTLRLDQLEGRTDLGNKCLRVLLKAGEQMTDPPECLQLTIKRDGADEVEASSVELGDFDMLGLFREVFKEMTISEELTAQVLDEYQERLLAG